MEAASFAEIEQEFNERVQKIIWCNAATVDTQGRPLSRVVHPNWEGSTGWMLTRLTSHKVKHLSATPYVSLAYIDAAKPVYIDCAVEWITDLREKQRVWDFVAAIPSPVGYDPAPIYKTVDDPSFGLLKLTPWRIEVPSFPQTRVWHAAKQPAG